jgi:hypothetical protein
MLLRISVILVSPSHCSQMLASLYHTLLPYYPSCLSLTYLRYLSPFLSEE